MGDRGSTARQQMRLPPRQRCMHGEHTIIQHLLQDWDSGGLFLHVTLHLVCVPHQCGIVGVQRGNSPGTAQRLAGRAWRGGRSTRWEASRTYTELNRGDAEVRRGEKRVQGRAGGGTRCC